MRSYAKILVLIFIILLIFSAAAFFVFQSITNFDRGFMMPALKERAEKNYSDTVFVGVISRYTPEKIFQGYQPIMDFLSRRSKYLFELKLSSSYDQTISQLKKGEVTAAFLGTYLFVTNMEGNNLRAVLKPLNSNGKPYFRSALIVKTNSDIRTINDLKGKKLALPSPLAFSGNWLQKIEFKKSGFNISWLKEIKHFHYHNSVAKQVLMGNFDAGVVKDRVANEYIGKGIKAILYSGPIPGSPIVISKKSDKEKVKILVNALLSAKRDSSVKNWDPEFSNGFTKAENKDYLEIKKMILGEK